jgi:hypothetical protein
MIDAINDVDADREGVAIRVSTFWHGDHEYTTTTMLSSDARAVTTHVVVRDVPLVPATRTRADARAQHQRIFALIQAVNGGDSLSPVPDNLITRTPYPVAAKEVKA